MPRASRTSQNSSTSSPTTPHSSNKRKSKPKPKAAPPPRSPHDLIIPIKPFFVELILARKKTHEFRSYKLKEEVKRFWLYESAPVSALTHVVKIGPAKIPGEVGDHENGIGNEDFDCGKKKSGFGYEVLGCWEIRSASHGKGIGVKEMKEKYGITIPQGRVFAPMSLIEGEKLEEMRKAF